MRKQSPFPNEEDLEKRSESKNRIVVNLSVPEDELIAFLLFNYLNTSSAPLDRAQLRDYIQIQGLDAGIQCLDIELERLEDYIARILDVREILRGLKKYEEGIETPEECTDGLKEEI